MPLKYILVSFFTFHFTFFTLKAQDYHTVDSLQNEISKFEARKMEMGNNANPLMDSVKANLWYSLTLEYWTRIFDTATYYDEKVLNLSKQIGYKKGIGNGYNGMGLINMQMKNYAASLEYYQKALKIRTETGDKKGMAWTFNNLGLLYGLMGEPEEAIEYHLKSLRIEEETGDRYAMASSLGKIGHHYFNLGNFPEALSYYLSELKILEDLGKKIDASGVYADIGNIYYRQGNYPEALKNYREELTLANETGDKGLLASADILLGQICYKQGNDTGDIRYMIASLKISKERNEKRNVGTIHYNLGLVYLRDKNYSLALKYADSSLNDFQNLSPNTITLADIYMEISSIFEKQGKLNDALDLATKGLSLARQLEAKPEMKDAYNLIAGLNAEMHNYETAYNAGKKYNTLLDSINNNEIAQKISTMDANYGFEKREDSARAEEEKSNLIKAAESKQKSIITVSAILISLLTLVMAILLIRSQQMKRRKDAIIFKKEKQNMEDKLANAEIALVEYLKSMAEKNMLLEQFRNEVENLSSERDAFAKNLKAKEMDENRIERLGILNKTTILTEDDWNKFKELFEQVHRGFLIRLKEKLPDLTQAEIRLICLTKLKLDTKQMGGILGVSFDTIHKSRYRLRKKLGISEESSIEYVVNTI